MTLIVVTAVGSHGDRRDRENKTLGFSCVRENLCRILVEGALHLFILQNICLLIQRCVAFFYFAIV